MKTRSKKKQLKQLEGKGWIRRRAEDNTLWIHPLIRSVFKNELQPQNKDCAQFLKTLWSRLDDRYPQDKNLFRQAAELFERAAKILTDELGEYHANAAFCFFISENFIKASLIMSDALRIKESKLSESDVTLARSYNDAGVIACYMQDFSKGMYYLEKAAKILELNAPKDPNAANIFSNIANIYIHLGDYNKAADYAGRAVEIFKVTPPKNLHEAANAYSIFGNALLWLKQFEQANSNFFVATEILQKIAPEGSIELARAFLDISQAYAVGGNGEKGIKYALKSIEMLKKFLPKNHADIISAMSVLSEVYKKSGRLDEAKKISDEVQKILKENSDNTLKKFLNKIFEHMDLLAEKITDNEFIRNYTKAANAYRRLGELEQAQRFITAALERISATTDFHQASEAYYEASDIFSAQNNLELAVSYAEKSLALELKNAPQNFSNLSTHYFHLGYFYQKSKNFKAALENFQKAEKFQMQCQYPDFDYLRMIQENIGIALKDLGRLDEAQIIFEKLQAEYNSIHYENHLNVKHIKFLLEEVKKLRAEQN